MSLHNATARAWCRNDSYFAYEYAPIGIITAKPMCLNPSRGWLECTPYPHDVDLVS